MSGATDAACKTKNLFWRWSGHYIIHPPTKIHQTLDSSEKRMDLKDDRMKEEGNRMNGMKEMEWNGMEGTMEWRNGMDQTTIK